jgi:hypothetical protein
MVVVMLFSLSSCLGEVNEETSPNCAVLSFSVGNITSYVTVKKYDATGGTKDTVVARTIAGKGIYFNINQMEGHIYSVDSLPVWANLKRVVPSIVSNGNIYVKSDEAEDLYYSVRSGVDSLDFSKTVELLCVSTDGSARRTYTVDIYQHKENTDTLEWKEASANLAVTKLSRTLYAADQVFAFAQNEDGDAVVTYADKDDMAVWSTPVGIPVEESSVVLFQNKFYGRSADGNIYCADPTLSVATWTMVGEQQVERLLAADACYLYAYDGTNIIGTADLSTWTVMGTSNLEMLPETDVFSVSHPSRTNTSIQQTVMAGMNSQNEKYGVVWYKVASADVNANQDWAYIQVTNENPYGFPYANDFSMTYYHGAIYAIGAVDDKYQYLYCSNDNGITWHPLTTKYPMPEGITPAEGAARIVAVDDRLWIVQENGKVWQGSIQ